MFRFVRYVVKSDAYIARIDHNCFCTILLTRRRLKAKKFMDDCIADCPSERILNRRKLTPEEWRQSKVAAIEVTAVVVLYCKTSNRAWVYQGCRSRLFCYYAVYLSCSWECFTFLGIFWTFVSRPLFRRLFLQFADTYLLINNIYYSEIGGAQSGPVSSDKPICESSSVADGWLDTASCRCG